jgi:hypothetical protein
VLALAPDSPDARWQLVEFYWLAKDYKEFLTTIQEVRDLHAQRRSGDFSEGQIADLKNYLQQAKEFEQKELVIELEKFLAE